MSEDRIVSFSPFALRPLLSVMFVRAHRSVANDERDEVGSLARRTGGVEQIGDQKSASARGLLGPSLREAIDASDGRHDTVPAAPVHARTRALHAWHELSIPQAEAAWPDHKLVGLHDAAVHALGPLQPPLLRGMRRRVPGAYLDAPRGGRWRYRAIERPREPVLAPILADRVAQFDVRPVIGLGEAEAEAFLAGRGCVMRVLERDGRLLDRTDELRGDRVNVAVYNNRVAAILELG